MIKSPLGNIVRAAAAVSSSSRASRASGTQFYQPVSAAAKGFILRQVDSPARTIGIRIDDHSQLTYREDWIVPEISSNPDHTLLTTIIMGDTNQGVAASPGYMMLSTPVRCQPLDLYVPAGMWCVILEDTLDVPHISSFVFDELL